MDIKKRVMSTAVNQRFLEKIGIKGLFTAEKREILLFHLETPYGALRMTASPFGGKLSLFTFDNHDSKGGCDKKGKS